MSATKPTWYEDAYKAYQQLGGEADYSDIYPLVKVARLSRGAPWGQGDAWVRNAVQHHADGKGRDLFQKVGPARYRIKR